MDFVTRLDLYAVGRSYVRNKAKKIDPNMIDVAGSDVNIFVGSASMVGAKVVTQLAASIAKLFLDSCYGADLDRYAWDRYRMTRKGASSALGSVVFDRATTAVGVGSIPAGTILRTINGVEYVTITTATFGALTTQARADVRALQAGKVTQVGKNYIRSFKTPSAIFDKSITVNNISATAGGENAEEDDVFKERIRDFWRTARRGTLGAIEFGAMSVDGVVSAVAIEALDSGGSPARIVKLYISDSSGVASDALARQVASVLDDFRAAGIKVVIFTSIPAIVSIKLRLSFRANVDTENLTEIIRRAVVEYVNSLPTNASLTIGGIYSVLQRYVTDGLVVSMESIVAPVGDTIPTPGQTVRTTLANVTVE